MNRTYSIRIQHYRTGVWTHNTSLVTSASVEEIQQQFERDYGKPVQVVEVSQQQLEQIQDSMMNSVLGKF